MAQNTKKIIERKKHEIDATGQVLGRLATRIATILRGKHKATYQPHIDAGDFVVISNMKNIKITGKKIDQKKYHHYSGYPGGLKTKKLSEFIESNPGEALRRAVYQMLPATKLRKDMMKRLTTHS
ncbi:MAG: 50S ribosomal protein L13 [bacterium]|nr:50S ribosomal protein L13 [bacterium]